MGLNLQYVTIGWLRSGLWGHNLTIAALQTVCYNDGMPLPCNLCPRHCTQTAFCGAGEITRCYRHRVEYSEEASLAPSHLFYLSGCNLRCRFCIGEEHAVNPALGQPLTPSFFAEAVEWGRTQRVKTLQWVGGEPGIHLETLCELMGQTSHLPPVVWKTNFYFMPQAFESLWKYVDTFVADFKFGNEQCAASLCGVSDYIATVTASLLSVYRRNPHALIVRHLLLPGHFDCCFVPILDWFTNNIREATFSLWDGYLPSWHAKEDPVLRLYLPPGDAVKARELIRQRKIRLA